MFNYDAAKVFYGKYFCLTGNVTYLLVHTSSHLVEKFRNMLYITKIKTPK